MSGTGIVECGLRREVNPPNLNSLNFPKDREHSGRAEPAKRSLPLPVSTSNTSGFRSNDLFCIERYWKQDEKGPSSRDADTTWQNACLMFCDKSPGSRKECKGINVCSRCAKMCLGVIVTCWD